MNAERHDFADRHAASRAAAGSLAGALAARLERQAEASLVVSGGSTPAECLTVLSATELAWHRVCVLPSDERCVPVTDAASNERMIRERLITDAAAGARFVPLAAGEPVPAPRPFAAVLVGMGEDGHFASLFPDLPGLEQVLDPDAAPACLAVRTASSPHPRLSLNLAALIDCDRLVLLAFGAAKGRVLDAPAGLPVAALLAQTRIAVEVVWAP